MTIPIGLKKMYFKEKLNEVPNDIKKMIVQDEEVINSFKSLRDIAAITNKRIIYFDKQGLMGNKVEIYSIPLKSILMFSSENAGTIDLTTEFQIWTKIGSMKMSFPRNMDIHNIVNTISKHIL